MAVPFLTNFDDFAEAMAVPNPNRPIQEAIAGVGRSACDRISARPELYAPTILQSPLIAACTPYWESQGYDAPVEGSPPFVGGQCDVTYAVDYFRQRPGGLEFVNQIYPRGPITSITVVQTGDFTYQLRAVGSTGTVTATTNILAGESVPTFTGPVRLDGQPDNCGDPPAGDPVPGSNPAPDPGPQPPGTGPSIDIRGTPIFILPPTLEISPDVTIELSPGEVNIGGQSSGGGGAAAEPFPGSELDGVGSGTGGGDNPFGEPPEGERWVGCCVSLTVKPPGLGVIPSSIPNEVYAEVVGNARLKFAFGGVTGLDSPIQFRSETVCLWEPVRGLQPTGVFVNLKPGFSYKVRPYSVPLEQ